MEVGLYLQNWEERSGEGFGRVVDEGEMKYRVLDERDTSETWFARVAKLWTNRREEVMILDKGIK